MTDYYVDYFFASNSSEYRCPGLYYECKPPNACARDPKTDRRYCCDAPTKSTAAVCWTGSVGCASNGSTLGCGNNNNLYCCNYGSETCTDIEGQINICFATAHDTLNNITVTQLNGMYLSLSMAKPSASSWAFTPIDLVAATNPAITQSKTSSASSSITTTQSQTSSADASITSHTTGHTEDSDSSSSGLKTGAIAGVAVGVVGAVALLGLGIFLLTKRQMKQKYASVSPGLAPGYSAVAPTYAAGGPTYAAKEPTYAAEEPTYAAEGPHDKMGSGVDRTYSGTYSYPSPEPPSELGGGFPGGPAAYELSEVYGDASHSR